MKKFFIFCVVLMVGMVPGRADGVDAEVWHFKQEFLPALVGEVPKILQDQKANGRFGSGIWIPGDQFAIFTLAAVWTFKDGRNPFYHDDAVLEAIMKGGDALVQAQDKNGQWMFRKKDNSTWGLHYDPWVYSRWVRTFSLIAEAMPAERRARWAKALELGYSGIAKHELTRPVNIPAHQAMGLYVAGKVLNHPEWCEQASAFLARVAAAQDPNGFWTEHSGPVLHYNVVYVGALGTYYSLSHDEKMLLPLQRAARFHLNFTYPDGTTIETIDERNPYLKSFHLPNPGFSFSPEGRGYLREQWVRLKSKKISELTDILASLLLYGEEGPAASAPGAQGDSTFVTDDGKGMVVHKGPWCTVMSAYTTPVYSSRWIQDRQNLVSLYHEKTGLILGGGNTKLQPLWSTFTVGNTALLKHRSGDENPNFSEPAGLIHVPSKGSLGTNGEVLILEYGQTRCSVGMDLGEKNRAQLTYAVTSPVGTNRVEAHLTFLPSFGKDWRTGSGKKGSLGTTAFKLTARQLGGWFEHNGWRVELPENASLVWPVLPHDPYRKDGRAEASAGRIVITLPFDGKVATQTVVVGVVK